MRELIPDDLEALREKRTAPVVARFRDTHHRVAWLFAMGLRTEQVAAQSGYSIARVASLSCTPSFQELIAQKRQQVDSAYAGVVDEYATLVTANMVKAERMLSDKLEDADGDEIALPVRDLIAVSRDAADRMGYGKHQTSTNVNVDFAARLDLAIKRSGKGSDSASPPTLTLSPAQPSTPTSQAPGADRLTSDQPQPFRRRA